MLIKLIKNILNFEKKQNLDAKFWIQRLLLKKDSNFSKFQLRKLV